MNFKTFTQQWKLCMHHESENFEDFEGFCMMLM